MCWSGVFFDVVDNLLHFRVNEAMWQPCHCKCKEGVIDAVASGEIKIAMRLVFDVVDAEITRHACGKEIEWVGGHDEEQ